MGFFVGSDPENSLTLLRRLPDLKARFGLPMLVSVSRKSFLRKITGQSDPAGLPVLAAGLAAEMLCACFRAPIICAPMRRGPWPRP